MKRVLLLFLTFFAISFYSIGQEYHRAKIFYDSTTSRYMVRDTIMLNNYSKSELFKGIQQWISQTYLYNLKIGLQDSTSGVINGRAMLHDYEGSSSTSIYHSFKYEIKDNKFRFTYTNFYQENGDGDFETIVIFKKMIFKNTEAAINKTITKLLKSLNQKPTSNDF